MEINSLEDLNNYLGVQDNSENAFYVSKMSQECKDYPCVIGIDEAGRGPVLGPMVYGIACCPCKDQELLKSLECADSKSLTEEKRDNIFTKLCENSQTIGWAVEVISPNKICNNMLSRTKHSLNAVSMDSAIKLIKALEAAGVNIEHIYVDTVGKPEKYEAYLLSIFDNYKITVAKKADSLYPVVSAASIYAKVVRDHSLQCWKFKEHLELKDKNFGSGYPGDPDTKRFLKENCDPVFGFPQLVRFSWSTASNVLDELAYNVEWENIEEETTSSANNSSITSFFKMTSKPNLPKKKHQFFSQRLLSTTNKL